MFFQRVKICILASHTYSFRRNVATDRWRLLQKKARARWGCIRSLGRRCRLPDNAWRLHLDTQRELFVNFTDISVVKCRRSCLISHLLLFTAAVILWSTHVNQIAGSFSSVEHINSSFPIFEQWGASWMAKCVVSAHGWDWSCVSPKGTDCGLWGGMDTGRTSSCLIQNRLHKFIYDYTSLAWLLHEIGLSSHVKLLQYALCLTDWLICSHMARI